MTKEQKNKIFKLMTEERNYYTKECDERIAKEYGKIIGANYMRERLFDVLGIEIEPPESEVKK